MRKLYILSALVSKREPFAGGERIVTSMVTGYRIAHCDDEARGHFVAGVFEKKPGFSIDDVTCMRVKREEVADLEE